MNHFITIITRMKDNTALRSSGEEPRWPLLQHAGGQATAVQTVTSIREVGRLSSPVMKSQSSARDDGKLKRAGWN